jgi:hypothetical protein
MGGDVKPTLLAFHGSGSNATVHTVQLARLMRVIKDEFEIESLEGKLTAFLPLEPSSHPNNNPQRRSLPNPAQASSPSSKAAAPLNAGCNPASPSPT